MSGEGVDMLSRNSYNIGMKSVVSEKGQVTIPKELRDRLGIRPGQVLDFEAERGRLVARKVTTEDPVDVVYGILGESGSTDEVMGRLRGDPEAQ
jgi:AbrB family looped-hinge helix DNA binding protein